MASFGLVILSLVWTVVFLILISLLMAISLLCFASFMRLLGFFGPPTWDNIFEPWRTAFGEIAEWSVALSRALKRKNRSAGNIGTHNRAPTGATISGSEDLSLPKDEQGLTNGKLIGAFYDELGVPLKASNWEIRKAYRRLAKKYHPDHNPSRRTWAEARMKRLNEAYETLIDPERRRQYDATLNY